MLVNLDDFIRQGLAGSRLNLWVEEPGFKSLYVRIGPKSINGIIYPHVLDLANAEVQKQQTGTMTNRIRKIRQDFPTLPIYAENVMVYEFGMSLLKMGFVAVDSRTSSVTHFLVGNKRYFCASMYWLP